MARIFITGSADGLGQLAAKQLVGEGHQVVLHARNKTRGQEAMRSVPGAEAVLNADLSIMEETKQLASDVNALGNFDAVIHNAGVYQASSKLIFKVNTLAPYLLTCLTKRPKRLIYLSSGMHMHGDHDVRKIATKEVSYSDSKLHMILLTKAVARLWTNVYANAVDPGWVPTKMGGRGAPDNLKKGFQSQAWLAVSHDPQANVSGCYFYQQKQKHYKPEADDVALQEEFLKQCYQITGIGFPIG